MTDHDESETNTTATAAGRYAELQQMIAAMAADFQKFYGDGNKAAGTRVRGHMQDLKNFAQTVRNEVTTLKNQGKE